jgi:RNA polymerase sigma-70 factor, ECF subfamily
MGRQAADSPLLSRPVPQDDLCDEDLIRRFIEGNDEISFARLVERHLPKVRRVLFGVLNGNREDMQDVEQEVLIGLCRDLNRFRFGSAFSTYLYRLARNKAIDFIRRQARQKRAVRAVAEEHRVAPDEEPLELAERRAVLFDILARLPETERLLVVFKEIEGLPLAEISAIVDLPEGTIKSKLHRTRRKMVKMIEGETA